MEQRILAQQYIEKGGDDEIVYRTLAALEHYFPNHLLESLLIGDEITIATGENDFILTSHVILSPTKPILNIPMTSNAWRSYIEYYRKIGEAPGMTETADKLGYQDIPADVYKCLEVMHEYAHILQLAHSHGLPEDKAIYKLYLEDKDLTPITHIVEAEAWNWVYYNFELVLHFTWKNIQMPSRDQLALWL